jgi:hypothetical protein
MKILNWIGVERETGVSKHRIKYALDRGRIGGIAKLRGAYVFTQDDVVMIRSYFAEAKPWQRITNTMISNTGMEVEDEKG